MRGVALLGSTGSIGRSTLEVLKRQRDHFRVVAGDLGEGTLVALHRILGQRQHVTHQVVHHLGPQACRQGRCLGHGPAEHGDLLVLTVQRLRGGAFLG